MTWATDMFGPELLVKEDDKVVKKPTDEVVSTKKFLALYFSAHVSRLPRLTSLNLCNPLVSLLTSRSALQRCLTIGVASWRFELQWCGPCRKFTPLFAVTYEDQPDRNEVEVR